MLLRELGGEVSQMVDSLGQTPVFLAAMTGLEECILPFVKLVPTSLLVVGETGSVLHQLIETVSLRRARSRWILGYCLH